MKTKGAVAAKYRYGTFVKDCPTIKGIINNIAAKKRISAERIEEMLDHYHNWAVDCMSSEAAPTIMVPNFGTFTLNTFRCKRKVWVAIKSFREGRITYEKACEDIRRFYPLYKRAHWEALRRGKGITRKYGITRKALNRVAGKRYMNYWNGLG